jgi:hypothetical protein
MIKNKYSYQVIFQSKSPDGQWKDKKSFPTDSSFYLAPNFKDEIAKMKREFKQDLPKFKTRTINRRTLN